MVTWQVSAPYRIQFVPLAGQPEQQVPRFVIVAVIVQVV
jgi:hypothetical protein